jgi:hypothetical protein
MYIKQITILGKVLVTVTTEGAKMGISKVADPNTFEPIIFTPDDTPFDSPPLSHIGNVTPPNNCSAITYVADDDYDQPMWQTQNNDRFYRFCRELAVILEPRTANSFGPTQVAQLLQPLWDNCRLDAFQQ